MFPQRYGSRGLCTKTPDFLQPCVQLARLHKTGHRSFRFGPLFIPLMLPRVL